MEFSLKSGKLDALRTDCHIVTFYANNVFSEAAKTIDDDSQQLSHWLSLKDGKLKAGTHIWVINPKNDKVKRTLAICIGESAESITTKDLRESIKAVANTIKNKNILNAVWSFDQNLAVDGKILATLVAEGITTGLYRYLTSKTKDVKSPALQRLTIHSTAKFTASWKAGLHQGQCAGEGINAARQLGNLPANYCTPSFLATQANNLADERISVKVLDEKQMAKLAMGSLLSVTAGSDEPAKLIVVEYKGASAKDRPTVLVGKGITFDTGGISLKPGMQMDEMKFDMCGAASVLGVMTALKQLQPKINVVAIIAAAENMPSGRATKPGDVVTSMSGQTIEVLNTDAEGRLVLCDALTYAGRFKPKTVIDIATLTGACVVALGNHASGLYANDQNLADELLSAGKIAGDKAWQMPLWDEYQKSLDSNFADIANIGGREGGSITAACFLSRFTEKYSWAHLDIAGTAWLSGGAKGATGRPVGLILQYLTGLFNA